MSERSTEEAVRGIDPDAPIVYGMCTACGSVEVALDKPTGTRNLSHIGESANYPVGYGCVVCS